MLEDFTFIHSVDVDELAILFDVQGFFGFVDNVEFAVFDWDNSWLEKILNLEVVWFNFDVTILGKVERYLE